MLVKLTVKFKLTNGSMHVYSQFDQLLKEVDEGLSHQNMKVTKVLLALLFGRQEPLYGC